MAKNFKDYYGNAVSGFERTLRNNKKEAAKREYKNISLAEQIANADRELAKDALKKISEKNSEVPVFSGRAYREKAEYEESN